MLCESVIYLVDFSVKLLIIDCFEWCNVPRDLLKVAALALPIISVTVLLIHLMIIIVQATLDQEAIYRSFRDINLHFFFVSSAVSTAAKVATCCHHASIAIVIPVACYARFLLLLQAGKFDSILCHIATWCILGILVLMALLLLLLLRLEDRLEVATCLQA